MADKLAREGAKRAAAVKEPEVDYVISAWEDVPVIRTGYARVVEDFDNLAL